MRGVGIGGIGRRGSGDEAFWFVVATVGSKMLRRKGACLYECQQSSIWIGSLLLLKNKDHPGVSIVVLWCPTDFGSSFSSSQTLRRDLEMDELTSSTRFDD